MRNRLAAAVATVVLAAPAVALACPACAGRDDPGLGVGTMIALLIAIPYLVATVAIRVIRRVENGDLQ